MTVIVFEDQPERFFPLSFLYPQFDLLIGRNTILENTARFFPASSVVCRARANFNLPAETIRKPALYISARLLMTKGIALPKVETKLCLDDHIVGFIKGEPPFPETHQEIRRTVRQIKHTTVVQGYVLEDVWDLVRYHEDILRSQLEKGTRSTVPKRVSIIGKRTMVRICPGAVVHDPVSIDVTDGPVYIDAGAVIRPFTTIVGPSYIGQNSIVERARIVKSTIGPSCRIGGEVEASIFQGYGNKYHEGFIGHSVIGRWVNLGAMTTNSDLKNNYSTVRVSSGKEEKDSGMVKLGCFIGDHSKTGIGTLIPTGANVGCFVNFFGGGMMPGYVDNFTWLTATEKTGYHLEKAINTARHVMERRQIAMSENYEKMIRALHSWQDSL